MKVKHINMPIMPDKLEAYKACAARYNSGLYRWIEDTLDRQLQYVGGSQQAQQPVNAQQPMLEHAQPTSIFFPPPPPPEAALPPFDIAKPMSKNTIQKYLDKKLIGLYSAELHTAHYMRGDEVVSPIQFEGMTQEEFDKETCPEKRARIRQDLNMKLSAFSSARTWTERLVINGEGIKVPEKRTQELREAVIMAHTLNNKIVALNAEREAKGISLAGIPRPSSEEVEAVLSTMKFGRTGDEEVYVETEEDKRERDEYLEMMEIQKEVDKVEIHIPDPSTHKNLFNFSAEEE